MTEGTLTEAELFAAQRDMLAHYKQRYPKIEFVESEAEPPVIAAYYPKYRLLYGWSTPSTRSACRGLR